MRVGSWAFAIGRVVSREAPTVKYGVVSAKNRIHGNALQTDAASSPVNYGGPLIDTRGRVSLFFFGYTTCPDVCPMALAEVAQARRLLGRQAEQVDVYFITVDPERDAPERLARYVAAFDPANGDARSNAEQQITGAFLRWYGWAAVIQLAITIGLVALVACLRLLVTMRRESRATHTVTVHDLWQRSRTQVKAMSAAALVVSIAAWASAGGLAYTGVADGLSSAPSDPGPTLRTSPSTSIPPNTPRVVIAISPRSASVMLR